MTPTPSPAAGCHATPGAPPASVAGPVQAPTEDPAQELARLRAQLAERDQRLADMAAAHEEFLRAVSHDLLRAAGNDKMALLTVAMPDPTGYGRIVRNDAGTVQRIVEQKDANDAERAITEIYSGIMAVPVKHLTQWLARLNNNNAQGEYYLTDIVAMAVADGVPVVGHRISDVLQVAGVNSPLQLAELERAHQLRAARALMEQGVRLAPVAGFTCLMWVPPPSRAAWPALPPGPCAASPTCSTAAARKTRTPAAPPPR